jgi:hypothetical protein
VTTVQTTYLAAGALTTDTSSPEKKAVSVASSDDAVGESAGNSIAFSNDLFNYAFIDDAHQSGKTAIAIGDTVQIFVVTVDVVGNVAVTEGATTETLTSISNAPPISTGGLIRGGIVPTGRGAGDTGDGWFRARGARSSRAAVQSALNPASVTARRGAATVPEGLTGTTTPATFYDARGRTPGFIGATRPSCRTDPSRGGCRDACSTRGDADSRGCRRRRRSTDTPRRVSELGRFVR